MTGARKNAEKRDPLHHGRDCKLVELLWKAVWSLLTILKVELPYDPEIPPVDIYLKQTQH